MGETGILPIAAPTARSDGGVKQCRRFDTHARVLNLPDQFLATADGIISLSLPFLLVALKSDIAKTQTGLVLTLCWFCSGLRANLFLGHFAPT